MMDFSKYYLSMPNMGAIMGRFKSTDDNYECKRTYTMDIPGISVDKVTVITEWNNRNKTLYLIATIDEGNEKPYEEKLYINTEIYDKYSWEVKDGQLIITLYEIINEQPKFELIAEDK